MEKLLVPDLPGHIAVSRIVDDGQADGIAQFVVRTQRGEAPPNPADRERGY